MNAIENTTTHPVQLKCFVLVGRENERSRFIFYPNLKINLGSNSIKSPCFGELSLWKKQLSK